MRQCLTRTTFVAAAAALLLLPLSGGAAAAADPPTTPTTPTTPRHAPTDHRLQQALDNVVAAGATGVALRIDDGRTVRRLVAGDARIQPRRAMRPGARLRAGSVTKTFVAALVLQESRQGRLRLSDSVEQWLPGLVPDGNEITLKQLLEHRSGLFDVVHDQDFFHSVFTDPLRTYTPRQLVGIATAHPPVFRPGAGFTYSSTNYILLGLVLQRATHRSVSALVRDRITRPLGLRHTYLPRTSPRIPGFHAHGYLPPSLTGADAYTDITRISPTALGFAGALVSTQHDLRRFYRALLGGKLLRPAQLAQMRTTTNVGEGYDYGLGLYRQQTACGPVWGHDGNAPGYETYAWNDRSGRRGFVLTVTTQPDDRIDAAESAALEVASCRMLGRPLPVPMG